MIRIRASRGLPRLNLHEVWDYRDLLYFLVQREIKTRYRQMALGPLWIIIQPLVNMVIYSILFGVVAKMSSDGLPYTVFSYAGLLPWGYFSGAANRAANSLISNQALISKVYFPRLLVPLVSVLSGLADFGVSFLILLAMMLFYGIIPSLNILTIPFFLLLAAATSMAVGLWTAALTVRFRDVGYMVSYGLQAWMFATPVVYSITVVSEQWRWLYRLNPMTGVIEGFRWSVLNTGDAPGLTLYLSASLVLLLLISGAYLFRAAERTIVDVL